MKFREVRERYIQYFKNLKHKELKSQSIIPQEDNSTLFINSGVQPLISYLLGKSHPQGKRIVSLQECIRTIDIEEVGDNRHLTSFEMAGNWSFGDYFKMEEIEYLFKFLTDSHIGLGLNPSKLYITVFGGDKENNIPEDKKVAELWQKLFLSVDIDAKIAYIGSQEDGEKRGIKENERIFYYDTSKNWWSRSGIPSNMPIGEPGGPDTEVFYNFGEEYINPNYSGKSHPNSDSGQFLEIANAVFMEYEKTNNGFKRFKNGNIDFGAGVERLTAATRDNPDIFKLDIFSETIKILGGEKEYEKHKTEFRIIIDHTRCACFIISAGVTPSNKDRGYVLRRLIRRAIFNIYYKLKLDVDIEKIAGTIIEEHIDMYNWKSKDFIIEILQKEQKRFLLTLQNGMKEFNKAINTNTLSTEKVFLLFTTYGFPFELIQELALEKGINIDKIAFYKKIEEHKNLSKISMNKKFKGGLKDNSKEVVAYHTTTHILHRALKIVLGEHVQQEGSNITNERLRFDFSHSEKLSKQEIKEIEEIVNNVILDKIDVSFEDMKKSRAIKSDAIGIFNDTYDNIVRVYSIGDFSKEFCGGPHVKNTGELGRFEIIKENSVSQGVRRIKAILV